MSTPDTFIRHLGPLEIFEHWALQQISRWHDSQGQEGFATEHLGVYESIWALWLRWLDGQPAGAFGSGGDRWRRAAALHVEQFIATPPAPEDQQRRRPKKGGELANFTAQRYWRLLRDVYAHAAHLGLRTDNPAMGLERTPTVHRRSREPQLLPAGVLQQLTEPARLKTLIPDAGHWRCERDRALLAVLAHGGITVKELIHLQGRDVRQGTVVVVAPTPVDLLGAHDTPGPLLDVQGRSLDLPPEAMALLHPWLLARRDLLASQRERLRHFGPADAHRSTGPAMQPDTLQPLFLSREAPGGFHTALDPSSVYVVVRRCLKAAYELTRVKQAMTRGHYVPAGPAAIRNSVIRSWIEVHGASRAAELAGIRSVRELEAR